MRTSTHQCGKHKYLRFGVRARAFFCDCVCKCMQVWQTCGSKLQIKTWCGTWLVIRLELKQKGERRDSWGESKEGDEEEMSSELWAVGEDDGCVWGEKGEWLHLQGWLPIGSFLSAACKKRQDDWGNWGAKKKKWVRDTSKNCCDELQMWAGRDVCKLKHTCASPFFVAPWKMCNRNQGRTSRQTVV